MGAALMVRRMVVRCAKEMDPINNRHCRAGRDAIGMRRIKVNHCNSTESRSDSVRTLTELLPTTLPAMAVPVMKVLIVIAILESGELADYTAQSCCRWRASRG